MPSPIAHIAAGVAVGMVASQSMRAPTNQNIIFEQKLILALAIVGSVLPDMDAFVGVVMADFGKYHNNLTHSLAFGLGVSFIVGALVKSVSPLKLYQLILPVFIGYAIHVLMDSATITRGVMLFWPITEQRYATPFPIFYGVRWSEGLLSPFHLITFVTESVFAVAVILLGKLFSAKTHQNNIDN